VPFCSAICPYCDFAVVKGREAEQGRRYVDGLLHEAELWRSSEPFDTLYLGGGTPSWLQPEELDRLFRGLAERLPMAESLWVSMEANPEDVSSSSVRAWREIGVDFLSLGVQALDDESLRFLGRRHRAEQARRSIELALEGDSPVVSVDLIYSLPRQTSADWVATLEEVAALGPSHLSCYELTYHRGTPFGDAAARGRLRVLGEERRAENFELTHRTLEGLGYLGYEVSNFARSAEHRSRHNQKYWYHVPYLGLGVSAHSFDGRRRWWNRRSLDDWYRAVEAGELPRAEIETLDDRSLALEILMLGLRTREGIDLDRFARRFDHDLLKASAGPLERLEARGLARLAGGRLALTLAGRAITESIAVELAP
jgi:oxygen-independent coproporphyrinogen-3 oxidase